MFVMTMNKAGLRKAAVAVGCAALILVAAFTVKGVMGKNTAAASLTGDTAVSRTTKVKDTNDMVTFLLSYGIEADLASAKVDKVKVPKIWDDSFVAFNEVIKQSGLDLSKVKGKTVEKWEFAAPNRSSESETAYAILLVKSKKVVGGYIISRPSGEVSALQLEEAVDPQTQTTMTEAEQQNQTEPVDAAAETAAELTPDQLAQITAAGEAAGLSADQIAAAAAAIEEAAAVAGALPTE